MLYTLLRSEPAADSQPKRLYRIQRCISKGICAWIYSGLRYVLPDDAPATPHASTTAGEATTSQGADETAGYVLDKEYVLKIIPLMGEHGSLDQGYLKWVKRQLLNLNTLTHPHIMVLRDCLNVPHFKLPSGSTVPAIAIVLDRATHSLHDYLTLLHQKRQVLPEDAARWWFQQLMLAVDHCHKRSPVWNNIRPPNILVFREDGAAKNVLKLSGLGLAQLVLSGNSENDKAKPSLYLPPEMFKAAGGTGMDAKLNSHSADIWACGVVLFQMMYPNTFHAHERTYQGHRWLEELHQKQLDSRQSPMCEQLLSMMLQEDPAQRATLEQVLTHPWFQVNLPPAALEMNERCLQRPPHVNGEALQELLNAIIYEATHVQLPPASA